MKERHQNPRRPTADYLAAHARLCGSRSRCPCDTSATDGGACRRCGQLERDGRVIMDGARLARGVT